MKPELWVIFIFGLVFLVTRIALAIRFPTPTQDQEAVFRTMLSLAAAGIAAAIPGVLELESSIAMTTVSATGATGVFALVYLMNPASRRITDHRAPENSEGGPSDSDAQKIKSIEEEMARLVRKINVLEARFDGADIEHPQSNRRFLILLKYSRVTMLVWGLGILFIGVLLTYAVFSPSTPASVDFLRLGFAIVGATLGATIPSVIKIKSESFRRVLRITTGVLLFVIVYFFNSGILSPVPLAYAFCRPLSGDAPLTVQCYNESSYYEKLMWEVKGGENSMSIWGKENIAHTFNTPGLHSVSLTVIGKNKMAHFRQVISVSSAGD